MNLEIINDEQRYYPQRAKHGFDRFSRIMPPRSWHLPDDTEMSISLITDEKIREINREYRR
jgi:probable rRNA maturation factor